MPTPSLESSPLSRLWIRFTARSAPSFDFACRYRDPAHMQRDAAIWRQAGAVIVEVRAG